MAFFSIRLKTKFLGVFHLELLYMDWVGNSAIILTYVLLMTPWWRLELACLEDGEDDGVLLTVPHHLCMLQ